MRAYVGIFGSQEKAAKAAGVSKGTMYRWLQGIAAPKAEYVRKLQRAAARLTRDVPAAPRQATAPATADDDEPYEPYDDGEYEADESEYEPEPERDTRPHGLHVVGGRAAPVAAEPQPAEPAGPDFPGFEMPAFLRQFVEDVKPLTQREGAALRESTVNAFMRFWHYGDDAISATNAQRAQAHIWRKVDREETEILVDFLIERGLKHAAAAQITRGVAHLWNYYAVGLILGPRFIETFRFYVDHGGFAL